MNIALIPARAGSKSVPKKNIKLLNGFPLIAYSIVTARLCKNIDHTIVSTESEEIAKIARFYGADVPFMRPAEYASDTATNYDVVKHFLNWYRDAYGVLPNLVTQLLPTTPLRNPSIIDVVLHTFREATEFHSLRSVHELAEPPQKMMRILGDSLTGFFPEYEDPEYWNLPRQTFERAYHPNGYVELIRPGFVISSGMLFGDVIFPYITSHVVEIDQPEDFEYLEYLIKKNGNPLLDALQNAFAIGTLNKARLIGNSH